jgi:ATP-dependent Clp protease ATP-binding subunit ClpA
MFERFAKDTRLVVEQAQEEARALGAPRIEAEHLLLALAAGHTPLAAWLAAAGGGHDELVDALHMETAAALDVVGVSLSSFGLPAPVATTTKPAFGTSAKQALELTLRVALERADRRLLPGHLLLALLRPRFGTVPRVLAFAGVTEEALRLAATASL